MEGSCTSTFLGGARRTLRDAVWAWRVGLATSLPEGDAFLVHRLHELHVPTRLIGTTPVAIPGEIVLVLSRFRGDVWMLELDANEDVRRQTP